MRRAGPVPVAHGRSLTAAIAAAVVVAGLFGAGLVVLSARRADDAAAALLVAGAVVTTVAALVAAVARGATAVTRRTALLVVAVVSAVPVLVLAGTGPATLADLVWARHLQALRDGGSLLADGWAPAMAGQPGAGAVTTLVARLSGLGVWSSALLTVLIAHVSAVLGARALARAGGSGERLAVTAAVLWAVGPGVVVATTVAGPGPLGVALSVWTVTAVLQAARAADRDRRWAWTVAGVLLAAATATTSLTAAWSAVGAVVVAGLATLGMAAPPVAGAAMRRAGLPAAVGTVVVVAAWSVSPVARRALAGGGAHAPGSGSPGPGGVGFGLVAGAIAVALIGWGAWRGRDHRHELGWRLGVAGTAVGVVAVLLLTSTATAEAAAAVAPLSLALAVPLLAAGLAAVWDLSTATPGAGRTAARGDLAPGARPAGRARRVPLVVSAGAVAVAGVVLVAGAVLATVPTVTNRGVIPLASVPVAPAEIEAAGDGLLRLAGPRFRFASDDPRLAATVARLTGGTDVGDVSPTVSALRGAGVGWWVTVRPEGDDPLSLTVGLTRVLTTRTLAVYRVLPAPPGVDPDAAPAEVVPAASS